MKKLASEYFNFYNDTDVTIEDEEQKDEDEYGVHFVVLRLSDGKVVFSDNVASCFIDNYDGKNIVWNNDPYNPGYIYEDGSEIDWGDEVK